MANTGWLSDAQWESIQTSVPILCVDVVPFRISDGLTEVGLIQRENPFGPQPIWCQIGGRILRDETVASALVRHLNDSLENTNYIPAPDSQPDYVMQFFTDASRGEAPWAGLDPRKHAVSLCYAIELSTEPTGRIGGEALSFQWFEISRTDVLDVWPGTHHIIRQLNASVQARGGIRQN